MFPKLIEFIKSLNMKYVVAAVIVLLVVWYVWPRTEGFYAKPGRRTVVLYYLPGCGHCQRMMPVWEAFTDKQKSNQKLDVVKINCKENPAEAEKAGVEGFPTVILYDGDKHKVFEGERTVDALEGFVN